MTRTSILGEIARERMAQRVKHGDQSHLPDGTGPDRRPLDGIVEMFVEPAIPAIPRFYANPLAIAATCATDARSRQDGDGTVSFADILLEEVFEALAEDDPARLRAELVQVAAVAVQWIEALDTRALAGRSPLVLAGSAVSPDCRVGKCTACSGDGGWDDERDTLVPCAHECHGGRS